jgi:hypothetical protein
VGKGNLLVTDTSMTVRERVVIEPNLELEFSEELKNDLAEIRHLDLFD